jgi:hypothetical protein
MSLRGTTTGASYGCFGARDIIGNAFAKLEFFSAYNLIQHIMNNTSMHVLEQHIAEHEKILIYYIKISNVVV